jgi:Ca2+-transporting ATPase
VVRGLSPAEAARRLDRVGTNVPPRAKRRSVAGRVGAQLRDPMIMLLTVAFGIVLWLGDLSDGFVICAVAVLNTVIGVSQAPGRAGGGRAGQARGAARHGAARRRAGAGGGGGPRAG